MTAARGVLTANRYTYVNGDPINSYDPTGHCSQQLIDLFSGVNDQADGALDATVEILQWCQRTLWDNRTPLDSDAEVIAQGYDASVDVFGDRVAHDPALRVLLGDARCGGQGGCRLEPSFLDGIDWSRVTPEQAAVFALWLGYGMGEDAVFTYDYFAATGDPTASNSDKLKASIQRQRIDHFRTGVLRANRDCEAAGRYTTALGCQRGDGGFICSAAEGAGFGSFGRAGYHFAFGKGSADAKRIEDNLGSGAVTLGATTAIDGATQIGIRAAERQGQSVMSTAFTAAGKFVAFKVAIGATVFDALCSAG